MQINPCPVCGSRADVFATGTSEMYGKSWQTYGVACKDDTKRHCQMEVSVVLDFSYFDEVHDGTVIQLWNDISNCRKSD